MFWFIWELWKTPHATIGLVSGPSTGEAKVGRIGGQEEESCAEMAS